MLLTMVDVVSCENPECRDFARIASRPRGTRSYYCQVCGKISYARAVDASLAASPERYKAYLRGIICSTGEVTHRPT